MIIIEYRFEDNEGNQRDYEFYADDYEDEIIELGINPDEYEFGGNYDILYDYFYDRAHDEFKRREAQIRFNCW